jgi:hypothetical protein
MEFPLFSKHESGCGHPSYCPHAGGVSISVLIHLALENTEPLASLQWVLAGQEHWEFAPHPIQAAMPPESGEGRGFFLVGNPGSRLDSLDARMPNPGLRCQTLSG